LEQDLALCAERGVDHVFAPSVAEMYPPGEKTRVTVADMTEVLCGPKRPGHFDGVTTIVSKLFHVAGACLAVFGRKDYQQLLVIRRMVRDLLMPVEVLGHATIRESDGLALSSRNAFLSPDERVRATVIARELGRALRAFEQGERRAGELRRKVESAILRAGLRIDYVELTTADELEPIADGAALPERALLAVAAFAGNTRLIDNLVLGEDAAPTAESVA
jgi:pantoate--beta-alanine ligase